MAAPLTRCYKEASGSGEQEFHCALHLDRDAGTTIITYVADVYLAKDKYDALQAGDKTEYRALTMGDLIDAAYGDSSIDKV